MRLVPRFAIVAVLALAVFAVTGARAAGPRLDLSAARAVDLTHPFDEKTIYWPNSPSTFKLTKLSDGQSWCPRDWTSSGRWP